MPDPLLVPAVAMLTGGGILAARDYAKRRFASAEDRYMAIYGKDEWDASNMDLAIHFGTEVDEAFKGAFLERLARHLEEAPEASALLREEADLAGPAIAFHALPSVDAAALCRHRHGVWFDLAEPGKIRVVWNHMQTDGVGMWNALRGLFDPNPPLVPYRDVPRPPALLPELVSIPSVARRLVWRGRLRDDMGEVLQRGLAVWPAARLRAAKDRLAVPFNLLTTGLVVSRVFHRHPARARLNVGGTAYFPFLEGRNRYGVLLCKVQRGDLESIVRQLVRQTRDPMRAWGTSAAQTYALGRMPDRAFVRVVSHFRKQVDVLVSSLPVGQDPIRLAGFPAVISCHPWELTLPYYFLLVGTRDELHVSFTSRYPEAPELLSLSDEPL